MIKNSVIWNATRNCPWDCAFCCISATKQRDKDALSESDKLDIVKNLENSNVKVDFSGGEPLISEENFCILEALANSIGRENVAITTTGKGRGIREIQRLGNCVSEVSFTYDFPDDNYIYRPAGYNSSNLALGREAASCGISTMAQTPLTSMNISKSIVQRIFRNLREAGIKKILLMKYFPSGRGADKDELVPMRYHVKNAITEYKKLQKKYKKPVVRLVASLYGDIFGRYLAAFNISPEGLLLSNSWSYNENGDVDYNFVLGNIKRKSFNELVGKNIAKCFIKQIMRNRIWK